MQTNKTITTSYYDRILHPFSFVAYREDSDGSDKPCVPCVYELTTKEKVIVVSSFVFAGLATALPLFIVGGAIVGLVAASATSNYYAKKHIKKLATQQLKNSKPLDKSLSLPFPASPPPSTKPAPNNHQIDSEKAKIEAEKRAEEKRQKEEIIKKIKDFLETDEFLKDQPIENIRVAARQALEEIEKKRWTDLVQEAIELPSIPRDVVKLELPNPGNTCWINSALKFLANTSMGDEYCNDPINDEKEDKKYAQGLIRQIIARLRDPNQFDANSPSLTGFLKQLRPLAYERIDAKPGSQQDPNDWITNLIADTKKDEATAAIETITTYQLIGENANSNAEFKKRPRQIKPHTLTISPPRIEKAKKNVSPTGWNINEQLNLQQIITARADSETVEESDEKKEPNYNWITNTFFTKLPDSLTIQINRTLYEGKKSVKNPNPIKLNENPFEIYLEEHKNRSSLDSVSSSSNEKDSGMVPATQCVYGISGAIVHIGTAADRGHYVYVQVVKNGDTYSGWLHSDTVVKELPLKETAEYLSQASLLHLTITDRIPL